MASLNMTVEVKLSREFKDFIDLFCETLETLSSLNDLASKDSCINTTREYQVILERMEAIGKHAKQVDYGKS